MANFFGVLLLIFIYIRDTWKYQILELSNPICVLLLRSLNHLFDFREITLLESVIFAAVAIAINMSLHLLLQFYFSLRIVILPWSFSE